MLGRAGTRTRVEASLEDAGFRVAGRPFITRTSKIVVDRVDSLQS